MTKAQALHNFYSSFGLSAYPANAVPDGVAFPWLTYEAYIGNYNAGTVNPTINLWYHTDSEAVINAKADEIAKAIGGGKTIACDDGIIIVYFNSAWVAINDDNDTSLKRRYTNLTIDFQTF